MSATLLKKTPLHALHVELGARMVEFAGYEMPVNYPGGILAEHRHCREAAALFDVSHMGQIRLVGDDAAAALESLVPCDIVDLAPGHQRYALFTNAGGGIVDDLMVARRVHRGSADLLLVVNAACKDADARHLITNLGHRCMVQVLPEQALLALQGPKAAAALARLNDAVGALTFLTGGHFSLRSPAHGLDAEAFVTRSGYTGEDGFEVSVGADAVVALARALLAMPEVKPAGLGARDTLRLEAGLCLYGHDINDHTTPVEAGLAWAIPKVRRPGGARAGRYPGAETIALQLQHGTKVKRVGLVGLERIPVREGAVIQDRRGHKLGHVTSGTTSPTLGKPIAMGYVSVEHAHNGAELWADVRNKLQPLRVTPMPFVPQRYHRG